MRLMSFALACAVLGGCSLTADFDRFHVDADGGGGGAPSTGDSGPGGGSPNAPGPTDDASKPDGGAKDGGQSGGGTTSGPEPVECDAQTPCPGTEVCRDNACTPQCDEDNPCAGGRVCRNNLCEDECNDAIACPSGLSCRNNRCADLTPSGAAVSNGGGATESDNYRMRIYVGGPQPAGTTSSARYHLELGPGAGRP